MRLKKTWHIVRDTFADFFANRVMKLSAALAYYTIFSLPGLIIIIIWVSDIFLRQQQVEGSVYGQLTNLVGKDATVQIQETIRNAALSNESYLATTVGLMTLLVGATSVFGEIQDSINQVWHLKAKPRKGRGWLKLIVNRLLSFSIIVSLGFLLLVSLIVNGVMDALIDRLTEAFPRTEAIVAYIASFALNFIITALLFGLIFKVLPDARISWKHVRAGAFTTAILFMVGKFLISFYLGQSKMSSAYGAAGSIIVILLWVYYSATILYFGAVFTRVYAIHSGSNIYPNNYAVWVEQREVESESTLQKQADARKVQEEDARDEGMRI